MTTTAYGLAHLRLPTDHGGRIDGERHADNYVVLRVHTGGAFSEIAYALVTLDPEQQRQLAAWLTRRVGDEVAPAALGHVAGCPGGHDPATSLCPGEVPA